MGETLSSLTTKVDHTPRLTRCMTQRTGMDVGLKHAGRKSARDGKMHLILATSLARSVDGPSLTYKPSPTGLFCFCTKYPGTLVTATNLRRGAWTVYAVPLVAVHCTPTRLIPPLQPSPTPKAHTPKKQGKFYQTCNEYRRNE